MAGMETEEVDLCVHSSAGGPQGRGPDDAAFHFLILFIYLCHRGMDHAASFIGVGRFSQLPLFRHSTNCDDNAKAKIMNNCRALHDPLFKPLLDIAECIILKRNSAECERSI